MCLDIDPVHGQCVRGQDVTSGLGIEPVHGKYGIRVRGSILSAHLESVPFELRAHCTVQQEQRVRCHFVMQAHVIYLIISQSGEIRSMNSGHTDKKSTVTVIFYLAVKTLAPWTRIIITAVRFHFRWFRYLLPSGVRPAPEVLFWLVFPLP